MNEECMRSFSLKTPGNWVGLSSGHLHLITEQNPQLIDVFEMQKGRPMWCHKYSVSLSAVGHTFPEINDGYEILSIVWEEEREGLTFILKVSGKIIHFNQKDEMSNLLLHLPIGEASDTYCMDNTHQQFETLFSV